MPSQSMSLSRRRFLQGSAALPLAAWLARNNAFAQAAPFVRYDIASPQGVDMLATYANTIRLMQARPETDPRSWLWQWYTHFVNGATTKANEINRLWGGVVTPESTFATAIWNTCQSHAGQNSNHFLPWHRMFMFFFEQIIRELSGRADFTMPYWDYTSSDPAKRGILPIQFRMPTDPVFGILYRPDRLSLANSGQRIDLNQPTDQMDITATMATTSYSNVGTVLGFCRSVDSGIHGRIHVLVGNSRNMGTISYAARDPLFWVHHITIDRLWASWNARGNVNPTTGTWLNAPFSFVDRYGVKVTGRLKDYFDTLTLGYQYDSLVLPPAPKKKPRGSQQIAKASMELVASATTKADLSDSATTVSVRKFANARQSTNVLGLAPATSEARTYLVLKNLHTWKQPEVLYHVYLTPKAGAAVNRNSYVGAIHFFDAEFHDHGTGHQMDEALGENFFSFDVTDLLRRYEKGGAVARDALAVTFVPGGKARKDAGAMVATIELIRQ